MIPPETPIKDLLDALSFRLNIAIGVPLTFPNHHAINGKVSKIPAIKWLRSITNWGLKDSKDCIDQIWEAARGEIGPEATGPRVIKGIPFFVTLLNMWVEFDNQVVLNETFRIGYKLYKTISIHNNFMVVEEVK